MKESTVYRRTATEEIAQHNGRGRANECSRVPQGLKNHKGKSVCLDQILKLDME